MVRNNPVSSSGYHEYLAHDAVYRAKWEGKIAERLGIAGQEITEESWQLVQAGIHPETGEVLRSFSGRVQRTETGYVIARPRTAYDFSISAPKSVSIMSLFDERLVAAHVRSVSLVSENMEPLAQARVRIGGANESRTTGEVTRCTYLHLTSRDLDPHLHSHVLQVNLTHDSVEQKWKALQAVEMFKARQQLSTQYREILSQQILHQGYGIDWPDHAQGFRLQGVPVELERMFSQRSQTRDQLIDEAKRTIGPREIVRMLRHVREAKDYSLTRDDIRTIQLSRIGPNEWGELKRTYEAAWMRVEGGEQKLLAGQIKPFPGMPEPKPPSLALNDSPESEPEMFHRVWNYGETDKRPRQRL